MIKSIAPVKSQGHRKKNKQNGPLCMAWPLLFIPAVGNLRECGEYGINYGVL